MTEPVPPELQGQEVPDQESLEFEAWAVALVVGGLSGAVAALLARAYAAWAATGVLVGAVLAEQIRQIRWRPMGPALVRVAGDARDLGQRQAVRLFTGPDRERAARADWRARGLPPLPDVETSTRQLVGEAAQMAESLPMTRRADLHAVAGRLRQAVSRAEATTRAVANEGVNAGVAEVARTMGLRLIWVAERNACLHCLAHAGWAVEPGELFPAGLTFDPLATGRVRAVAWPPLHPNCRCRVRTYSGPAGAPPRDRSQVDPAARLAAEARRSTVYQWTDYASGAAKRRAAEALLQAGADLPVTVERRARAALRRGREVRRPR